MADAVTSQTIVDNARNVVMKFTNLSDGTGESGVIKVDLTGDPINPTTHLTIWRCQYDIKAGGLRIQWKATSNVDALILSGFDDLDFGRWGGITNNAGTGVTGQISFTTVGFAANSSYTVILEMKKNV